MQKKPLLEFELDLKLHASLLSLLDTEVVLVGEAEVHHGWSTTLPSLRLFNC